MLKDPKLSPEERARIEKQLAQDLRGKPDPTGRLDSDVTEAKAKVERESGDTQPAPADAEHPPEHVPGDDAIGGDRGRPEVRPDEPGQRSALGRAIDRASGFRKRTLSRTKHYATKISELRQLDSRAIPATRLRKAIMSSLKARTPRSIKLGDLDVIHPIDRDAAVAKAELRADKLREAGDRIRQQGALDDATLNELIPSQSPIRVVKYGDKYMVFDGNGRIEAIRRAFPDMPDLEVRVVEYETGRDLSALIDKARHQSLRGDTGSEPATGPEAPSAQGPHDQPPGIHEPDRGGSTPTTREPTDRAPTTGDKPDGMGGDHPHPAERTPSGPGEQKPATGHDHGGIAEPASVQGFVSDMADLQGRWPAMDPQARADALGDIINRRLQDAGVHPTRIEPKDLPPGHRGQFNREAWAIELPNEMLGRASIDPDVARQLASTVAHEAHHGEQYFLAARGVAESYRAGPGRPARPDAFLEFMKKKGINADAARAAFEAPPLSPAESQAARAMYDVLFSNARQPIYREMAAARAEYDKATAAYEANKTPETLKARSDAARRLQAAQQAYEDLPEEVAARQVGGAVADEFSAPGRRSPTEPSGSDRPGTTQSDAVARGDAPT
ncbi:MAG TPA: hypothetical protein VIX73_17725, partial [Kofleriaceae bacterium]